MNPELLAKIAAWRQKAIDGTLTKEEMVEAIKIIREDRISAFRASETGRKAKAHAVIPSADDLLAELGR